MPTGMNFYPQRGQTLAKPLNIQRLEASLDIKPFISYAEDILSRPLSSSEDSDSDINTELLAPGDKILNGIVTSKCGKISSVILKYFDFGLKTDFFLNFQIVKMINYKFIICHKLDPIENGCKTFY